MTDGSGDKVDDAGQAGHRDFSAKLLTKILASETNLEVLVAAPCGFHRRASKVEDIKVAFLIQSAYPKNVPSVSAIFQSPYQERMEAGLWCCTYTPAREPRCSRLDLTIGEHYATF